MMKIPSSRAAFAAVLASLAFGPASFAVPAHEASTVAPNKVLDVSMIKPLFKSTNRVAVAGYQVAFVTRNKATAHAMGLLSGGSGAKASIEAFLGNVDYELMKEIADAAYAGFVKKLQESGVEVVPMETVRAAKAYAQLDLTPTSASSAYKVQFQGAHYIIVPAADFPLWFNNYDGLAGGKGSRKNVKVMADLSKELNAAILQPSIAIDFAYLEKSGGKLTNRASVEAQNGMLVVPAASVFWGSTEGLTYTKFVDGFWAEGGTGKWAPASSANNAALVKGLAGLGIDIGPVSSKKAIVLEADRALFKTKSLEVLDGTSEVFKRAVQSVRK